ncbi:MAG: biotin--[acetyl-CoA-carboxylase] ligase [Thermoprotei archaeon]|nr:MAG: biotin--[acetyl-CoA-carboxylase] ligase [Thermoprotei archaeon]
MVSRDESPYLHQYLSENLNLISIIIKLIFYFTEMKNGKMYSNIIYFKKIGSTMDIAKEYARKGYPEWTIIVAEEQTSGRGRMNRKWVSPKGGLWFSIILRPKFEPKYVIHTGLIIALSITEVLIEKYNLDAKVKWPNDVYIDNVGKIAGILVESSITGFKIDFIIAGIGLNTNVDKKHLEDLKATSLLELLGKRVDNKNILRYIIDRIKLYYSLIPEGLPLIIGRYNNVLLNRGEIIRLKTPEGEVKGILREIDSNAGIVLMNRNGNIVRYDVSKVIRAEFI